MPKLPEQAYSIAYQAEARSNQHLLLQFAVGTTDQLHVFPVPQRLVSHVYGFRLLNGRARIIATASAWLVPNDAAFVGAKHSLARETKRQRCRGNLV